MNTNCILIINISGQKKDPGIPNLFPFKEEILKQAEEKKRRVSMYLYTNLLIFENFNKQEQVIQICIREQNRDGAAWGAL